jgi:hypothetical protein
MRAGDSLHQEHLMSGRGPQSFKKRQKEQLRKEKQQEKVSKRLEKKPDGLSPIAEAELLQPLTEPVFAEYDPELDRLPNLNENI